MIFVERSLGDGTDITIVRHGGDIGKFTKGHRHREDAMAKVVTDENIVRRLVHIASVSKHVEAVEVLHRPKR